MNFLIFLFAICTHFYSNADIQIGSTPFNQNWGYKSGQSFKAPNKWKHLANTTCGGERQSPINIMPDYSLYLNYLDPLTFKKVNDISEMVPLQLHPTSMSIAFNPNWNISFGRKGCWRPISLHWHWGSDNTKGSEHRIDGKIYPMESHLITYNCYLYSSFEEALVKPSGLHVIGIFYQIGSDNPIIGKIVDNMDPLINNQTVSVSITEIHPKDFLPRDLVSYYRYEGSITMPPCTENVIWTVMRDTVNISDSQLSAYRKLSYGLPEFGPMVNNFRPVIKLRRDPDYIMRIVFISFNNSVILLTNVSLVLALLLASSLVKTCEI